jgi:hypothetical protein
MHHELPARNVFHFFFRFKLANHTHANDCEDYLKLQLCQIRNRNFIRRITIHELNDKNQSRLLGTRMQCIGIGETQIVKHTLKHT